MTEELKPFEGGVNPAESVVTEQLKPFEGGVNPVESVVTEELKPFEGGVNPAESSVTEQLKPFEGGVNPVEPVLPEKISDLKVALSKADFNTIKTVVQDTIVVNQSQVLKEKIEGKTKTIRDKNDKKIVDKILPNTGEIPVGHAVPGGLLLVVTMILAKRKVKK